MIIIIIAYRMNQLKFSILRNNAYALMKVVLNVVSGTSENQCQIICQVINHVITIISERIKKENGEEATVCLKDLNEDDRPAKAVEMINQWLPMVTTSAKFTDTHYKKFREEVHVSSVSYR